MYTLNINGKIIETEKNIKLLPFLRDELGFKSVKNGCSEGACGTCMILVDGKAVKSCIFTAEKAQGKSIITLEGLSAREKEVYCFSFAHCGAVQCGFCTPGMIISAKALIYANSCPTRDEIKTALRQNICRCTGYKKIIDAVMLAAKIFSENASVPKVSFSGKVGENMLRVDAHSKASGTAIYADDIVFDGMLFGGAVRTKYPRALVKSIDVNAAKAINGVKAVITAADLQGSLFIGHLKKDQAVLVPIGGVTHFLGDAVALVAADTKEALALAIQAVKVDFNELPAVFSSAEAMMQNGVLVHENCEGNLLSHEHLVRGNAEKKIKESAFSVTQTYNTPPTEHAFLEPETAVALPENDGFIIYSGDQGIYQTKKECAEALGLPEEKVRVIACMVGGGFGGKEDMSVQHHAAVLAQKTGAPVKFSLSRQESILIHPKRHGFDIQVTSACDKDGNLTAMKAVLISDTGAVASLGGPVLQRACTHAAGPYHFTDIDIEGFAYYTNNPPAGAFRGFGVTQSCFAAEMNINLLAEKVGLSPWEMRYKNAIRPGEELPNGQIADDTTALAETLNAIKPYFDSYPKSGIACAIKNSGLGVGIPDTGRCRLVVKADFVHIYTSAACIGQGLGTVITQMVCEESGLLPQQVIYQAPDTSLSPNSGNTTASRQTVFTGEAAREAAKKLKAALSESNLQQLSGQEFYGEFSSVTDKMGSDKQNPVSHVAYGYATQLVILNDDGTIKQVVAAHDVGVAVNPISVEGQIEGGVVMSLGYALTEDYPLDNGRPLAKYATLGLFKADKTPDVKSIIIEHSDNTHLAAGAKGIGEIASIPTAPAVAAAYYYYDGEFRTTLPLKNTPYKKQ